MEWVAASTSCIVFGLMDPNKAQHNVPASFTSYCSLLLLLILGEMVTGTSDPTNLVWDSLDKGANWQTTVLPLMKIAVLVHQL